MEEGTHHIFWFPESLWFSTWDTTILQQPLGKLSYCIASLYDPHPSPTQGAVNFRSRFQKEQEVELKAAGWVPPTLVGPEPWAPLSL